MRRRRPPEPFVFFVDECLGALEVPGALRLVLENGETVIAPSAGTLDESWLPAAGRAGWICFSKDRSMQRRKNHLGAILEHGVTLVTVGEANGKEHARRIAGALPLVRRIARQTDLAFVARIEPTGDVVLMIAGSTKLERVKTVKPKIQERGR